MRAIVLAVTMLLAVDPASTGTRRERDQREPTGAPSIHQEGWSDLSRETFVATCVASEAEAFCRCWLDLIEARFPNQRDFQRAARTRKHPWVTLDFDRCYVRQGRGR